MTNAKTTDVVATDDWDPIAEGWEVAETDIGSKVDWETEIMLRGLYKGRDEVANDDGELIGVHLFKDEHGEDRFAWATPRLTHGLKVVPFGSEVAIRWDGKVKLDATRTLNTFTIAYKPPSAGALGKGPASDD